MYEQFGAVVTGNAVEFKLFFPDNTKDPAQFSTGGPPRIERLQVVGDFQVEAGDDAWDIDSAPEIARSFDRQQAGSPPPAPRDRPS